MAGRTSRKRPAAKRLDSAMRASAKNKPASDVELVKMAILARRSGVPAPTIKHYIREGCCQDPTSAPVASHRIASHRSAASA